MPSGILAPAIQSVRHGFLAGVKQRNDAQDQIALFGFATALEQQLFERLLSVTGIGPKVALNVLSGIEPVEFVRAVRTADVARLCRVPGIGKKTAERIALELKDKLPAQAQAATGAPAPTATP